MTTLMSWCVRHWFLTLAAGLFIAVSSGLLPSPRDVIPELATRPEVGNAFQDPAFGKQDALLFVFSFVFLGPFAGFIGLLLGLFALGSLGGLFLPLGRKVGLPEWCSTTVCVILLGAFVYLDRDVWMPTSLWVLGLVARAWIIAMS